MPPTTPEIAAPTATPIDVCLRIARSAFSASSRGHFGQSHLHTATQKINQA